MSEENVVVLREMYEAINRRDWDAFFRHAHPEFAFTYRNPAGPDARTRRGREEVAVFAEEYGGAFGSLTWEPEDFVVGENRIVAIVNVHSRPHGGDDDLGIVVRNGHLWTMRDGLYLAMESFPEVERALEAAGFPADSS
jgi:ketosteroid isomerase-like protein